MRFLLALCFCLLQLVQAAEPVGPERWEKEIAAFEKADASAKPEPGAILFIGSSSIRLWKTLAQDFPQHRVLNRGFGGSQIADSTHFAERIIFPYAPSQIVLYAGGNDLNSGKTPQQVVADFRAFIARVRTRLPDVPVAYISIAGNPARWAQVEKVREVNREIAALAKQEKNLTFIDVFTPMLGADGLPQPDIFVADRLHMNEKGYALWKTIVAPHLRPHRH